MNARRLQRGKDRKRPSSNLELLRMEVQKGLDELKQGKTITAAKAFAGGLRPPTCEGTHRKEAEIHQAPSGGQGWIAVAGRLRPVRERTASEG
jgi:hypothetical protein